MTIKQVTTFVTDDGREFDNWQKAQRHEAELGIKNLLNVEWPPGPGHKESTRAIETLAFILNNRIALRELLATFMSED